MKKYSAFLILVLISISPSILSAQGKTIKINIVDKRYVPPTRTPKIPQEFKTQGARFVVRAGDVIKICNADKFIAKPMSLSKENSFQGLYEPGGLHPGNCISIKAQNPGNKPIAFWLHDEMHSRTKIFMVVLPANWPNEGEEDTPLSDRTYIHPGDEYGVDENGDIIDDDTKKRPCTQDDVTRFSKITGSWKSYALKLTIKGSCDKISGTMEWVEWCSGVDDKTNNYFHYAGTFTGEPNGLFGFNLHWSRPKMGLHDAQTGTANVSLTGTMLSVSGFGCGNGELKKE